jgi:predicted alpha/beta-fold hydrolase
MHSCAFMSELDAKCNWRLFNFESEQHMVETFSVNRHEVREKVAVPMLLLQPLDDPLHKSNPYYSIEVDMYIENPNIIYAEIDHGNHFGFYEGNNLLNIFENKRCYTYPPKLATVFFQNIIDQEKRE